MPGPVLDFDPTSTARGTEREADTRPAPGMLETFAAGARVEADRVDEVQEARRADAYRPIVEALVERGVDRRALHHGAPGFFGIGPDQLGAFDYAKIWREARRLGLEGLPENQQAFEQNAYRRGSGRSRDQDTLERAQGVGGTVAGFGGAMAGSFADPINVYTLPFGGGGATIARRMIGEAVAGATVEAVQAAGASDNYARMGEDYTVGQAAMDIVAAGAGGAALRGAIEVAPGAVRAIDTKGLELTRPIREAIDAKLGDRDLARAFSRMVPEHLRTPEQEAALHVLERGAAIDDASPYVRSYEGLDTHLAKLEEAMAAVEEGRIASEAQLANVTRPPVEADPEPVPSARPAKPTGGKLHGGILSYLRNAGLPEHVARGIAAGIEAESRSSHSIVNPTSGAHGIGQWLGPRKKELFRRYGARPTMEQQLDFLVWELRGGDHGGKSVLGAADEVEALRRYITDFMRPAKGAETTGDLTRGMAALGRGEEDIPLEGEAAAPLADLEDAPVAIRSDALDAERPTVAVDGRAVETAAFRADDIGVDAELMQFKSGGDSFGVTERLHGVEDWDPIAAGMVTVWEGADGRRLIADGHQRLGLARRIQQATGQEIRLNAFVLRESDGFSAIDARILTALKNIGEGTGTATDAAKVFRDVGMDSEAVIRRLPPRSALVRDGKALARLDPEAFGAVVNDVIPENYGAAIGALVEDRGTHMAMVRILAETDPANRVQAEAIIRQAKEAGFTSETQDSLFGSEQLVTGLFAQRAKILDRSLKELRKMKGAFGVAVRNAETLEAGGNRIDVAGSSAAADANARALALVDALALRKGNAVNELLDQSAKRLAAGEPIARVLRDFVAAVSKLDLADIAREAGYAGRAGDGAGGSGRAGEPEIAPRLDGEELSPRDLDAQTAREDTGPSLFDDPAAAARFDDAAGEGVREASESVWHDIKQAPIVRLREKAAGIEKAQPPIPDGHTRLWRGERPGAEGKGLNFTNDLPGIALPFYEGYRGRLMYLDIPEKDLAKYEMTGAAARGAEFHLPAELAAKAEMALKGEYEINEARALAAAARQDDFAAPTADQARKALELKTEGRQKGTAAQKAAGEDGGLFDIRDTTGQLFDLDDGKGARSAAEIRAELDADRAGLEEIRKCLK